MIVFDLDNTLRNSDGDYPHTPFALGTDPGETVYRLTASSSCITKFMKVLM